MTREEVEDIEVSLFLEAIHKRYGHDFRHYSRGSIKRRIRGVLIKTGYGTISEMIPPLLYDQAFFEKIIFDLAVVVTEMFRDPEFFKTLREQVVAYLKTYPFVKIWHAGCATGEEAYSLAIVLKEEGLYDRATIFATDFNDVALSRAREGIYPLERMKEYTGNYQRSGGIAPFAQYYRTGYGAAILDPSLKKNITFANHNLVTDSVFSEVHLIVCRNVLIYFDKTLQNQVLKLFRNSLIRGGILALGSKETLQFSDIAGEFKTVSERWKIYRKAG